MIMLDAELSVRGAEQIDDIRVIDGAPDHRLYPFEIAHAAIRPVCSPHRRPRIEAFDREVRTEDPDAAEPQVSPRRQKCQAT